MNLIHFTSSDKSNLEKAFAIREEVFVVEQKVEREEEFDEFDLSSAHLLIENHGKALSTARWRITNEGIKLERFAVLASERGKGLGSRMLNAIIEEIPGNYPIYLHAQVSALDFYKSHGFKEEGELFMECDIEHYKMTYTKLESGGLSLRQGIDYVAQFHRAFGLNMEKKPTVDLEDSIIQLRHKLMQEENEEYFEAAKDGDLIEVADALGDMLYILCGTIISHGMQDKIEEVYTEIQRSNMSKLDANGKPIYREDGKVMKSDRYFKPDIASILKQS